MRLVIRRAVRDDNKGTITYEVRFRLQSLQPQPQYLPNNLSTQTIDRLAQRWFAITGSGERDDGNASLSSLETSWQNVTLGDLAEKGFTFSSPDAVTAAAVEERVKRACWMIVYHHLYEYFFLTQSEEILELGIDTKSPPQIIPLPVVADELRKKAFE